MGSRQTEGEIEGTEPRSRRAEQVFERREVAELVDAIQHQRATTHDAMRHQDGLALVGR